MSHSPRPLPIIKRCSLKRSPYFQAGFGLMVRIPTCSTPTYLVILSSLLQATGVGLTVVRQGILLGSTALRRRMLVSLEINNKDRSYEWFLAWMAHQADTVSSRASWRGAHGLRSHQLSVETTVEQRKNGSSSAVFKLVAGPGTHWLKYQGAWMQVGILTGSGYDLLKLLSR